MNTNIRKQVSVKLATAGSRSDIKSTNPQYLSLLRNCVWPLMRDEGPGQDCEKQVDTRGTGAGQPGGGASGNNSGCWVEGLPLLMCMCQAFVPSRRELLGIRQ